MKTKLKIEYKNIDKIVPYINNTKKHPQSQIDKIKASILEFGMCNPILIHNNTIVAGHGRYEALKQLNHREVPTIDLLHLSEAQRKAYIIADNRIGEFGIWDNELLAIELSELDNIGFDMETIGFDDSELDEVLQIEDDFFVEPLQDDEQQEVKTLKEAVGLDLSSITFIFETEKADEIKVMLKDMTPEEKGELIYKLLKENL